MKQAIVAIEDRRFYTNSGVDLRGIARAAFQDVTAGAAVQGASTIPQQFVKISLAAENDRTVFQKLREAALAYQLTRRWSKERILRNYLNSIYFGNGAYGIESAARTYFALQPRQAAAPAGRDALREGAAPARGGAAGGDRRLAERVRPGAAPGRRQAPARPGAAAHVRAGLPHAGRLRRPSKAEPIPTQYDLTFPKEDTKYPYFTSWIKQQVVDQLGGGQQGAQLAFEGGLQVKTTIDSKLQTAAQKRDQGLAARTRPARGVARGDLQQGRHGARDGRRRRLRYVAAVQPRHPGPAPARLRVQAVRARRGAEARASARTRRGRRRS